MQRYEELKERDLEDYQHLIGDHGLTLLPFIQSHKGIAKGEWGKEGRKIE